MNLNYDNSLTGTTEIVEHIGGILVLGKTDFEVSYSGEDSGEYTLTVMNVGKGDVNSVIVSIPEQNAWSVSGVSTSIIGNLDGGTTHSQTSNYRPPIATHHLLLK